jgi:hypothetical protein
MLKRNTLPATLAAAVVAVASAIPAGAATVTGWNTGNVEVGATPPDGDTGSSVVYDRAVPDADAVTNGQILFTPPEAVSPGIKVVQQTYADSGPGGIDLTGCIMTSSNAVCDSPFQSGKRIKQQMTGLGPVDLVFDVAPGDTTSVYQVFHRLINATGSALTGFAIELGFGTGDGFVRADAASGLSFSSLFTAQPTGSGSVSTQFPFGLFGNAASNPNFSLDGFFAPVRTGFTVDTTDPTRIVSTGFFGPYDGLFGAWLSGDMVPQGAFWDNDNNPDTDALLMAWLNPAGEWELRREIVDLAAGTAGTLASALSFSTFDDLLAALLGDDFDPGQMIITAGEIEDLANLNVNFAVALGNMGNATSFTLRSVVYPVAPPAIPLPAGGVLLVSALGLLAAARRRRA